MVLHAVADHAAEADALLRGVPGVLALADRPALILAVEARLDQLDAFVTTSEARIEHGQATSGPVESADIEETNAALDQGQGRAVGTAAGPPAHGRRGVRSGRP